MMRNVEVTGQQIKGDSQQGRTVQHFCICLPISIRTLDILGSTSLLYNIVLCSLSINADAYYFERVNHHLLLVTPLLLDIPIAYIFCDSHTVVMKIFVQEPLGSGAIICLRKTEC